jgi:hypothetical protein
MVVFDTEALLIFYLGEEGADKVEDLLKRNLHDPRGHQVLYRSLHLWVDVR